MNDHLTIPVIDSDDCLDRVVLPTPSSTPEEQYIRPLIPDIWTTNHQLRKVLYQEPPGETVLIPEREVTRRMAQNIHGGTILGLPVRVVAGITEPMIAFPLKRMDYP